MTQPRASSLFSPSPFRITLEQQRKRAKELRNALRQSFPEAIERFRRHYPHLTQDELVQQHNRLSDAQWIIARELGLPSWSKLKAHVTAMEQARIAIQTQGLTPDHELSTLHIRCGSDIQNNLTLAGFRGDFLAYSDPFCQGPVVSDKSWLSKRVKFLSEHYVARIGVNQNQLIYQREQEEQILLSASAKYQRVVLWFEHDSYDQLTLARCLAHFNRYPASLLEMVTVNHYPGSRRFIGLGQLPEESLLLLWQNRQPVTAIQCQLGSEVWEQFRSDNPSHLIEMVGKVAHELPYLSQALLRHCQEFPSFDNGLGLTEQLVLNILAEQPCTNEQLFQQLTEHHEPLPWLGDIMLDAIIDNLRLSPESAIYFDSGSLTLILTQFGQELLSNKRDWMDSFPLERWLGGVCITGDQSCWRWDQQRRTLIFSD
ncbi:DUF1835 domain-containing protein [Photorhabdus hainanensis]|uniref:DUF1835 domain-containing protein n=1 Tax=Photorhabdus hainanensis TaxID=1004166 RepID=UPI001BD4A32B|nr:DUF1835 domain-containing protein [Photorhabdus hainanensis]MBS9432982.1 DUF1835 domain-containing protein [Photorhabdus hainanensis]